MNKISQHIYYLLLTCRKVSVPGLGTFSATYEAAQFYPENCSFYPSKIRIIYNPDCSESPNLLIDSLKRKLKIHNEDAKEMISNYVSLIEKDIRLKHYSRLEGIGYLIEKDGGIKLHDSFWKHNKYLW